MLLINFIVYFLIKILKKKKLGQSGYYKNIRNTYKNVFQNMHWL